MSIEILEDFLSGIHFEIWTMGGIVAVIFCAAILRGFTGFGFAIAAVPLLSVCPEMIFRLRKPFGNKDANSDCLTGRKTSLFSNFFGNLDNNSLWL